LREKPRSIELVKTIWGESGNPNPLGEWLMFSPRWRSKHGCANSAPDAYYLSESAAIRAKQTADNIRLPRADTHHSRSAQNARTA
jgi:hypothetical protein